MDPAGDAQERFESMQWGYHHLQAWYNLLEIGSLVSTLLSVIFRE